MNATNTGAGPANDEQLDGYRLLFGLVGKLLYLYPQQDFIDGLLRDEAFLNWPLVEDDPTFAEGVSLLRDWNERYRAGLDDDAAGALRTDATRLFAGLQTMAVPPWESVYFNKERMIFQEQTLEVRTWYRDYGMQIAQFNHEPEDHIGLELDFVSHVLGLALDAGIDTEQGASHRAAAVRFVEEHPQRWASTWAEKAAATAATPWYRGLALVVPPMLDGFARTYAPEARVAC